MVGCDSANFEWGRVYGTMAHIPLNIDDLLGSRKFEANILTYEGEVPTPKGIQRTANSRLCRRGFQSGTGHACNCYTPLPFVQRWNVRCGWEREEIICVYFSCAPEPTRRLNFNHSGYRWKYCFRRWNLGFAISLVVCGKATLGCKLLLILRIGLLLTVQPRTRIRNRKCRAAKLATFGLDRKHNSSFGLPTCILDPSTNVVVINALLSLLVPPTRKLR